MSKYAVKRDVKKREKKARKRAKKMVWGVYSGKSGNKPELHYLDFEGDGNGAYFSCPINQTADMRLVNGPIQGATGYNRIGDVIKGHSIHIRATPCVIPSGTTYRDAYTANAICNLRMMVVYDRDPNGLLPDFGDILEDHFGTTSYTNALSGNFMRATKRFRVLMDKIWTLNSSDAAFALNNIPEKDKQVDFYYKLDGIETRFLSSTTVNDIGSVQNGAILVVVYQECYTPAFSATGNVRATGRTPVANSQFGVQYHCRYKWTED